MEELMSKGQAQNKQRIPKRHGPGRCLLPTSVSKEGGKTGKILFVLIFKWAHKLKELMN